MSSAQHGSPADPQVAETGSSALERWEIRTEWWLAAIAVIFLVIYSAQVLLQPPADVNRLLSVINRVVYLAFVGDYIVRLALADPRWRWFFRHLPDLVIVALPLLRPLKLLRLVVVIHVVQRVAGDAIRGRVIIYAGGSAILLVYVASLAVLEAERNNPEARITSFGQAVWWAITTVTTVGYGDLVPVTPISRMIAAGLMIGGISLVGAVTATLASWIVQRVSEEDAEHQIATRAQIDGLRADVRRLAEALESDRTGAPGDRTQELPFDHSRAT